MTVELIEIRNIKVLNTIRTFLDKVSQPEQLWELYLNLYLRYIVKDTENQILATTALEILAISRRPLSLLEFGWAVALGTASVRVFTVETLLQLVDYQRVMSLIQLFVARTDFADVAKRQVKLVHQLVKEFIVGLLTLYRPSSASLLGAILALALPFPAPIPQQ